jgi:predicted GIY-YIG superfamily endonuclease
MIIYKITNTVNNMVYIGQTINNPLKRWSYHTSKISRSCMYKVLNKEHKQAKGKIFSYLENV